MIAQSEQWQISTEFAVHKSSKLHDDLPEYSFDKDVDPEKDSFNEYERGNFSIYVLQHEIPKDGETLTLKLPPKTIDIPITPKGQDINSYIPRYIDICVATPEQYKEIENKFLWYHLEPRFDFYLFLVSLFGFVYLLLRGIESGNVDLVVIGAIMFAGVILFLFRKDLAQILRKST